MPFPPLDAETHRQIRALRKHGMTIRAIAGKLGLSRGTVFNHCDKPILAPPSSNKKTGKFQWREFLPAIKQMQGLKKRASWSQDEAVVDLSHAKEPIGLISFSDQHLGAWSTDYSLLEQLTNEIVTTENLYIALLGDYGHYAIKLRGVLEVSDNLLPPEQQTDFIESWFNEIWHKVLVATWDNHGVERQEKQAGESSVKRILSRKVIYHNGIGHSDIKVGKHLYRGAFSHRFQGRSIENPCHGQMRYMRRQGQDRDFAMAGDSHVPGLTEYRDGPRLRIAINSGSIQTNSGFAKRYFSLTTNPDYPMIVLYPDEHRMQAFWSIADWLKARSQ